MNAYVLSGWIVAMAGTALYSGWTIVTSRRIATQVLAIDAALASDKTRPLSPVLETGETPGGKSDG